MTIKAVFFDLDGVLLDSIPFWFELFNSLLLRQGKETISLDQFKEKVWGVSTSLNVNRFVPEKTWAEIKEDYVIHFKEYTPKISVFSHTLPLLKSLKAKGQKIAVITNSHSFIVSDILQNTGILPFLDTYECITDGVLPKPDPDMLLRAKKTLGLELNEILFVGDTKTDYDAGKNAGIFTVGFGFLADRKVDKLKEILGILDELNSSVGLSEEKLTKNNS